MNFFDEDINKTDFYEKHQIYEEPEESLPFIKEVPIVITQNIVYSCDMSTTLNLSHILDKLATWGPQLNIRKFPALILRLNTETIVALLLFESGRVICTGSKSAMEALYCMQRILLPELQKIGYRPYAKFKSFVVYNLVANTKLPFAINLQKLANDYSYCCTYEPEVFPSLDLKHPDTEGANISLFESGKVIISGVKSIEQATKQFNKMYPLFCRYQTTRALPKIKETERQKVLGMMYTKPLIESKSVPLKKTIEKQK